MPRNQRQRRMLDAMGIKVFEPLAPEVAPDAVSESATARSTARLAARPTANPPSIEPAKPVGVSRSSAGSATSEAVAKMDWPTLQATVAACRDCALCESRKQTVFGVGNLRAHWMIVGEAPGENEDLQGEPFVGASGQLLEAMLKSIGLTRQQAEASQQVYIANTIKCRPPRNRNPSADEMQRCEPYLVRQIALVQPKVILAMGRFAVQSLLRTDEAIGRLRGRVHQYEGVPLIVTYHPAYLLRNPIDKARAWEDLCLAMEVVR
jgi:uracil-DNA glycosylase